MSRPSEGGGNWNRAGRRSGGDRPLHVQGTPSRAARPLLSIQCFEQRHGDCDGACTPWLLGDCECPCHRPRSTLTPE